MNELTVEALINLLKQFDPLLNVVAAIRSDDDYQPVVDATYNEHGDIELVFE